MRVRPSHVLAYLLGVSASAWIDLLHQLPSRVRVALEVALVTLPLAVVSILLLQPVAAAAGRAVADRLLAFAASAVILYWFATIRLREWRGKPVPIGEQILFVIVLLVMACSKKKGLATTA